jgi:hypothetical protein
MDDRLPAELNGLTPELRILRCRARSRLRRNKRRQQHPRT